MIDNHYSIRQTLFEDDTICVFRAIRIKDNLNVIIKQLKTSSRTDISIAEFIHERKLIDKLDHINIPKILSTESSASSHFSVFEDIGGSSLHDMLLKEQFSLSETLDIALSLSTTIKYIHQNNIIHANINLKNIIYNKKTKAIQITGFAMAIDLNKVYFSQREKLNFLSDSLYISPEQTGFTNYNVDYRSDIYAFGVCLYNILLGKVILFSDDYIYNNVSVFLEPLFTIDKNIPKVLSDIVNKMMQKSPSKRYQIDDAIIYDISRCIKNLEKSNSIINFSIATTDKPKIDIGDSLFGREKEQEELLKAISQIEKGKALRVLISGDSGIGKTRLALELINNLDTKTFYIIKIKFDQYKNNVAYTGFKQLFKQLNFLSDKNILKELETKMHQNTPKVLGYYFPSLKHKFKVQVDNLDPTKEELIFAIKDFFQNIINVKKQLVIFFDDLQWIDQSSSDLLLASILQDLNNPYVHFVATYRNSNIKNILNLNKIIYTVEKLDKNNSQYLQINLSKLLEKDIALLLRSTFFKRDKSMNALASVIYEKTGGNIFYIKTFLEYLLEKKEIIFKNSNWYYSVENIKQYKKSVNVDEILSIKFNKLDDSSKLYLMYLSVLGNSFNMKICLDMMNSFNKNNNIMLKIIKYNFIELYNNEYNFTHDKIQSDIFSMIDSDRMRKINLDIGIYLENLYKNNNYEDITNFTNHLNKAYIKLPKKLFKYNINSLDLLLHTNSYTGALEHIAWVDEHIFRDHLWITDYSKAFEYSLLKARALYLNSRLDDAYSLCLTLLNKVKFSNQKILCFYLLKNICVTKGKGFKNLIDLGDSLLFDLGLPVPKNKKSLELEVDKLDKIISINKLFKVPTELKKHYSLTNKKKQGISSLLVEYWEAVYYTSDIELMKWAYLNIINLSFKYGNSTESTFGYVLYGADLVSRNEYKKAELFAKVALQLNKKFADTKMLPKIHNFVANFINPYTKKIISNIVIYKKSIEQSKINGDIVFGTWATYLMHFSDYLSGNSLESVQKNISNEKEFLLNSGDEKMIFIFEFLVNHINNLQYNEPVKTDENVLNILSKEKFYPALAWYAILKAQNYFLNNDIESGIDILNKYVHSSSNEVIMFSKISLHFIRALLLQESSKKLSLEQEKQLASDIDEIHKYYKASPSTFRFEKSLLDVQSKKHMLNMWDTAKKYDKVILEAEKQKNYFYIALTNLCAGRFFKSIELHDIKKVYLNESIAMFNEWGAYSISKKIKVNELEYISEPSKKIESINTISILKSFSAISQAKNNKELINILMKIILQNATATRSVLILKNNTSYFVKASVESFSENVNFLDKDINDFEQIPKRIIYQTISKNEVISLDYPSESSGYQYDPYILENKPTSLISIPFSVENSVVGILYLENSELSIHLSLETIKTLEFLLKQFIIIYNNITLYDKVSILNQAIEQSPISVVMTDVFGNIEYINEKFISTTGYSKDELFGSNMRMLNSKKNNLSFYADLWKTLLIDKKIWKGLMIDKVKDNHEIDLYSTIFPIFNDNHQVVKLVAIQEDVTEKNIKDKLFIIQTRQAKMGEMISMIAHQWRQPLAAISAVSANLKLKFFLNIFDLSTQEGRKEQEKYYISEFERITGYVNNLSTTIDDFRNFYKPNKVFEISTFENVVIKVMNIVRTQLENDDIKIIEDYSSSSELNMYINEMMQVILNILKNAQDNFKDKNIENKLISIMTDGNKLTIYDNGGGISTEIIDDVFEAYFSTKSDKNGTGLGLYMSKIIVNEHHKGTIKAVNTNNGVSVIIELK